MRTLLSRSSDATTHTLCIMPITVHIYL